MRAILLAAGLGTRLRPLTNTIPKCLVSIHEKPLLQIWLENLSHYGIAPFLVNTHYLSGQVEEFIKNSTFEDQVLLFHENQLLGTAGTLINNLAFFQGEDGLLIHADNYCLANFKEFMIAHSKRPTNCVMTMMIFRTETPSSCGIVELNKNGVVIGFHEKVKTPPGNLANGAIYLLSREFLEILGSDYSNASDFSTEIIHQFIGQIYSYETPELFIDVGSPESYQKSNRSI